MAENSLSMRLNLSGSKEAVSDLLRAEYTLYFRPKHEKIYRDIAAEYRSMPIPLQSSKDEIAQKIKLIAGENIAEADKLKNSQLLKLAGIMIQFTDYVPRLALAARTDYSQVEALHVSIVEAARNVGTLSYSDQFELARAQTQGDISETLWLLFIASRHYGRWLDGSALKGLPDYSREQKKRLMVDWQQSIAAVKPFVPGGYQDVAGDAYYCWTHALSGYVFRELPADPGIVSSGLDRIFNAGTFLMQHLVNNRNPYGVISDHKAATAYGKSIAQALSLQG